MLLSQIIPPSPSLAVPQSLSFMYMSPWLACKWDHQYHLSRFHTNALIYDICISLSDLTSLCIIGSRLLYLIKTDSNAFLF